MVRMVRKTRKQDKVGSKMTIPQLRKAFEHMDKFRDVESFRREWKKTFGKEITKQSAVDYLQYVSANSPKHSQRGGAISGGALSGAPLDYSLQAGADIPYGSYLRYVSDGFGFANQDSLTAQCGKEAGLWPSPAPGSGCNLVGGGKKKKTRKQKQKGGALPSLSTALSEFMSRPAGMDSPPGPIQDASMVWKGMNTLPSPRPEINSLSYTHNPTIYNAQVSPQVRQF